MPVVINEEEQQRLRAVVAIVVYAADTRSQALAVEHPLIDAGTRIRLGPGRNVSSGFFKQVAAINGLPLAFHPENVVASGHDAMAWYEPASTRRLLFRPSTDTTVETFDNAMLPQPPLVFVAKPRSLTIFALAKSERPALDTELFCAPYWNVYQDHRVCLGSMNIPARIDPSETTLWTRAFFASNFTHLSSAKRWRRDGTYAELLQALNDHATFPKEWLVPAKLSLAGALA